MEKIGQRFRLGIWTVKEKERTEFIAAWQASTNWLAQKLGNERGAVLLEDVGDAGRFISYAPISDPQAVIELMSQSEFQALWADVMQFCDEVQPHDMRVVGSVARKAVE